MQDEETHQSNKKTTYTNKRTLRFDSNDDEKDALSSSFGRGRKPYNARGGSSAKPKARTVKFNHSIKMFMYKNICLFKGDIYPYRGIFFRNGGRYSKQHYGYLVPLDNVDDTKSAVSRFVESIMRYDNQGDLDLGDFQHQQQLLIDDDSENSETEKQNIQQNNVDVVYDI